MAAAANNGGAKKRKKLGFLLTVTLIWLCLYGLAQILGLFTGVLVLFSAFRGEVALLAGIATFLSSAAVAAAYLLSILFVLKSNRLFYVIFAVCQLLPLLTKLISDGFDPASLAAFFIVLPFVAGYWVLLFVCDTPRRHFGLPILHPNKSRNTNASK